jgi:tetratricopeptide (TPR) repeat protein
MRLGELRLAAGAWPAAPPAAEQALRHEPDLALARYVLGRALLEQGAVDLAAGVFDQIGEAPDALGVTLRRPLVAIARAIVRLRQRRWEDAVDVLEAVTDEDPTGEAAFHLGNACLGLRRLADAMSAYRAARARGFADPDLDRRLALVARLTDRATAPTEG